MRGMSIIIHHSFILKRQIDYSSPHVMLMLAEIQEQQALMKTYEITMKKMRNEIESKDLKVILLLTAMPNSNSKRESVAGEVVGENKSMEKKMNASGSVSILDNVRFSDLNPSDFVLVLHYLLRSVRNYVKLVAREMRTANWDIDAAANMLYSQVWVSGKRITRHSCLNRLCVGMFSPVLMKIPNSTNRWMNDDTSHILVVIYFSGHDG